MGTISEGKSDKRERIFNAALDLVSENGLHDAPMSVLAKRADVAAGSIYRYFKNKEALLNELYKELNFRLHRAMTEGWNESSSVKERFELICRNLMEYYLEHPKDFAFIGQYIYTPQIAGETYSSIYSESLAPLVGFFREAQKHGELKKISIEMTFSFIHGPIETLVRQQHAGRIKINKKIISTAIELCWDALKK